MLRIHLWSVLLKNFMWNAAFHSGMSASGDLKAAIGAVVPVGVVATLLDTAKTILVLPRYLDAGGAVFVDSGAFAAFQKKIPVDWKRVFSAYESILGMTEAPENLTIVAPDVVGDQQATLRLWEEHAVRICTWIARGARVVMPLQKGSLSIEQLLDRTKGILGTSGFCCGIPSNLKALSPQDCAGITHHDFHILGRVVLTPDVQAKVSVLLANNQNASFTADANWLRSRIREISAAASTLSRRTSIRDPDTARTKAVKAMLCRSSYPDKRSALVVMSPA
jgi:hypothetical protein